MNPSGSQEIDSAYDGTLKGKESTANMKEMFAVQFSLTAKKRKKNRQ